MSSKDILIEWIINFIKHKDAILKTLEKIEKNKEGFGLKAIYQDKDVYVIVEPFIKDFDKLYKKIDKGKNISIVLFNTIENFEIILENWKRFIDFEKLTIYFVNMFSTRDAKWIVKPYLHNKITDEKSLKQGLNSMFSMVDSITQQEVERKTL